LNLNSTSIFVVRLSQTINSHRNHELPPARSADGDTAAQAHPGRYPPNPPPPTTPPPNARSGNHRAGVRASSRAQPAGEEATAPDAGSVGEGDGEADPRPLIALALGRGVTVVVGAGELRTDGLDLVGAFDDVSAGRDDVGLVVSTSILGPGRTSR
jgi:hypothetical protein